MPVTGPGFFNGFPATQPQLTLNGGAALNTNRLRLTDGNQNEARSAFFTAPVNVQQFNTSFDFQLTNPYGDGFTFTIQGVGSTALGAGEGGLGYAGIAQSIAVKFDLYNNVGEGPDSTGLYTGGAAPIMPTVHAINLSSTGINLHSGDIFNAQLNYDGTTLTVVITDTMTNASATQSYTVNIPALVGGSTGYVGFTAGSGGATAVQEILNWSYSPKPVTGPAFFNGFPATQPQLTLNGGAVLNANRLRLTDGNENEARSAFFSTPVNVQQFNTSFDFQLTNPYADGLTFTIQGIGPTALGAGEGGLGYTGIAQSVAVKFDLYSNEGEGPDSTGLYTDGAAPIMPSINLSSTGINLHSGDIFNAHLSYNGATLVVVITDTVTNATATQSYTVNIPALVGGSTGYVGFTGGSGGATAIQDILNWSYASDFTETGPEVSGSSPNYGAPAALIEITGINFGATQGNSSVTVGGAPSYIASWSNTAIAIQVPSKAATGNIVVTAGGQSSNGAAFTFYPYPAIANVSPGSGEEGTPVTITGSNLLDGEGNATVAFNGTPAAILSQVFHQHPGGRPGRRNHRTGQRPRQRHHTEELHQLHRDRRADQRHHPVIRSGGSGGATAVQDILNWSYSSGSAN